MTKHIRLQKVNFIHQWYRNFYVSYYWLAMVSVMNCHPNVNKILKYKLFSDIFINIGTVLQADTFCKQSSFMATINITVLSKYVAQCVVVKICVGHNAQSVPHTMYAQYVMAILVLCSTGFVCQILCDQPTFMCVFLLMTFSYWPNFGLISI